METPVEVLPPVNPVVAKGVLTEVDNLIDWQKNASQKFERAGIRLSRLIADVSQQSYWIVRGYSNEAEYAKKTFPRSESQYYILRRVGIELREYPIELLEEIGVSKCQDLVRLKKHDGVIRPNWFVLAKTETRDSFRRMVRAYIGKALPPAPSEPEDEIVRFKVWKDARPVFNRAFEIARHMAGDVDSKSHLLNNIILPEFLSGYDETGASLITENNFHLMMIRKHIKHLRYKNDPTVFDRLIGEVRNGIAEKKEE
jgi:hypothetical protein